MPKYFLLADAERALPEVGRLLHQAVFHRAEFQKADQELNEFQSRIRISGGARVDRSAYLSLRARRDTSLAAMKQALEEIERIGALVKDLDIGLIDFLCLYEGREVCLCWKLGEDRIGYWHGTEEGFRGRKPIDDRFLKKHSTE
ncbi:MAG TPA: DUF2203 domain-containing protein [Bryobacteraceae bacterium]|jgi:hypothetical protein|nr:DUF2203 domain-containing protein [Bryobacteraceae bacterium]